MDGSLKGPEKTVSQSTPGQSTDTLEDYPLGKRRAWSTVFGSFLILICATGVLQAFGVFEEFYATTWLTRYSASDISWIGSVQVFLELVIGAVGGKLYDSGYCRSMLWGGSSLFTFSILMLSFIKPEQYYQAFLAQAIGLGTSIGFLFVPACTLVSHHFKTNKALAVGIIMAGGPLGGIIYSIMLNYLFHSKVGFGWGVRIAALFSGVCLLVGNLAISVPPPSPTPPSERKHSMKSMRDWPYLLTVVTGFVILLETYFPVYFVQLFAKMHGVSQTLTFYCLALINVANMISRVGVNYYANKFGAINLFIISCALNGGVIFGMLGAGTAPGLVLFSLFHGLFFGSTLSLYYPMIVDMAPSEADMGKVMGYAWGPGGVAALIGPPLGGALLGKDFIWWRAVVFAALCFIVAAMIQLVARQIHVRRLKTRKEDSSQNSTTATN
ncbi:hypothetical protein AMATHDRAFT_907 [Amanita thiersii Skay4041]|uniref:Major facilitator superfamily (MFS) profile domain-containing protein n=1 Tax=Amanita thiersii Skay4041 TaxID=703135 RepID=A0A2A9NZU6_9AGAR|nr:hypothetical protein AMATHDRAFT_907 [Amanita thiersii Skay4041]